VKGKKSEETKLKMSLGLMGNTNGKGNKGNKGKVRSEESKLKQSISNIKYDPNYEYCDVWRDCEYKSDLRKDYCENKNCKNNYKRLVNHHIDLDKKNCHPKNIMTLCNSCHIILHAKLQGGKRYIISSKDFVVINRLDHIAYINRKTRKKIIINRIGEENGKRENKG
jgi:hypothetical protein